MKKRICGISHPPLFPSMASDSIYVSNWLHLSCSQKNIWHVSSGWQKQSSRRIQTDADDLHSVLFKRMPSLSGKKEQKNNNRDSRAVQFVPFPFPIKSLCIATPQQESMIYLSFRESSGFWLGEKRKSERGVSQLNINLLPYYFWLV